MRFLKHMFTSFSLPLPLSLSFSLLTFHVCHGKARNWKSGRIQMQRKRKRDIETPGCPCFFLGVYCEVSVFPFGIRKAVVNICHTCFHAFQRETSFKRQTILTSRLSRANFFLVISHGASILSNVLKQDN